MKKTCLIFFLIFSRPTFAQNVNEKIKSFENNLNSRNKTKSKKLTLKERMDFHEINTVSIAVVKDCKLEPEPTNQNAKEMLHKIENILTNKTKHT